jgi:hypothetical protein
MTRAKKIASSFRFMKERFDFDLGPHLIASLDGYQFNGFCRVIWKTVPIAQMALADIRQFARPEFDNHGRSREENS